MLYWVTARSVSNACFCFIRFNYLCIFHFSIYKEKLIWRHIYLVFLCTLHFYFFAQERLLSAAQEDPRICPLTILTFRGLVTEWQVKFPPCVACLHVPKIQYMTGKIDDDKEETCSLTVRLSKQAELLNQVWTSAPMLCPFTTQRDFSLLHQREKLWSVLKHSL